MTDYWSAQTRRYNRAMSILNPGFAQVAEAVADTVASSGAVLELAAGTGLVSQAIAPRVSRFVVTDQAPAMLEALRARFEGQDTISVQEADALSLPFEDEAFGAVVVCNLLHLLPAPEVALAEARRVLRPGGLLVAPTFCHAQHLVAAGLSRLMALGGFPISTRFRGEALERLVGGSGFVVEDTRWFPGPLPVRFVAARK